MLQRWLVAIIGLPLLLLVLLACPPWATALLVCAIAGVAAYELLHVAGKNVPKVVLWGVILSAAAQCWLKYAEMQTALAGTHLSYSLVSGVRWATVMLLFFAAVVTYGTERAMPFSTVAAGVVGGIVFPALYAYLILLRVDYPRADLEQAYGQIYILAPFFIAFAGDSLAMYFGMWPAVRQEQMAVVLNARLALDERHRQVAELPVDVRAHRRGRQRLRAARRPVDVAHQARGGRQGLQPFVPDARRDARPV